MSFRAVKELVSHSPTNLTKPNKLLAASIGATALSMLSKDKETKEEAAAVAVSLSQTAEAAFVFSMCPKKTAFTFIALEAGNRFFWPIAEEAHKAHETHDEAPDQSTFTEIYKENLYKSLPMAWRESITAAIALSQKHKLFCCQNSQINPNRVIGLGLLSGGVINPVQHYLMDKMNLSRVSEALLDATTDALITFGVYGFSGIANAPLDKQFFYKPTSRTAVGGIMASLAVEIYVRFTFLPGKLTNTN